MKRSAFDGQTIVYRYGCPVRADLDEIAMDQLRRGHRLRNQLVEVSRAADEQLAAGENRKQIRVEHNAQLKQARGEAVAEGLHWATGNAVLDSHRSAVDRMIQQRAKGRPSEMRFHSWDGTGRLHVQLQRPADTPPRTVEALATGTHPRSRDLRIEMGRERSRGRRDATLHARVVSTAAQDHAGHTIALPIIMHRPIPDDADITNVEIIRRRTGPNCKLHVCITVRLPAPEPRHIGRGIAVRLGWASAGLGGIRVASVIGASDPPPHLHRWVVHGDGRIKIVVPDEIRALLERAASIRSVRDEMLAEIRESTTAAVRQLSQEQQAALELRSHPSTWRSPRRFAWLAHCWPSDHPHAAALEAWRKRDKHLWCYETHERDQVIARRRDVYRAIAAWLCDETATIALPDYDMAALKRARDDEPKQASEGSRRNMHIAAPGELRQAIIQAAGRRGIHLIHPTTETTKEEAA